MSMAHRVIPNLYRDSVSLMQVSDKLTRLPGVRQASAVMATESNLGLLVEAGMLSEAGPASPNDLLIVVQGDSDDTLKDALAEAEKILAEKPAANDDGVAQEEAPRSIEMGLNMLPGATLALIATPGDYATAEALKALNLGLNVMIFSDGVSLDDERLLKQTARDRGLLVMGPDCGTAIINGVPLGFANVIRRGPIGVVAASGTGLQQVTSLIHRWGGGITQAIGIGSHDLHDTIGGISMLHGIESLAADPDTRVIVLISKPPAPGVASVMLDRAAQSGKPVVVDFIGADPAAITRGNLHGVRTLEDAAIAAVALAEGRDLPDLSGALSAETQDQADRLAGALAPGQKYVRGLFSGGTFCFESLLLFGDSLGSVYSNTPLTPELSLPDVWKSQGHTLLDLGDDHFTKGRPHPMIDFRLRNERLIAEASDPETAIILLDVVLGHGSNADPAAELIPALNEAQQIAKAGGQALAVIGFVCGTDADPQNLSQQEARLREAGVTLTASNAEMARLASAVLSGR